MPSQARRRQGHLGSEIFLWETICSAQIQLIRRSRILPTESRSSPKSEWCWFPICRDRSEEARNQSKESRERAQGRGWRNNTEAKQIRLGSTKRVTRTYQENTKASRTLHSQVAPPYDCKTWKARRANKAHPRSRPRANPLLQPTHHHTATSHHLLRISHPTIWQHLCLQHSAQFARRPRAAQNEANRRAYPTERY